MFTAFAPHARSIGGNPDCVHINFMSSTDYAAALSRLCTMSATLIALATEMRCIYPPATIHRHLLATAAALGEMPQWELSDL